MKPQKFAEQNLTLTTKPYQDLPAHISIVQGTLICCWKLTFKERLRVLFGAPIWHTILTFNKPLQPQKLEIDKPEMPDLAWPRKSK